MKVLRIGADLYDFEMLNFTSKALDDYFTENEYAPTVTPKGFPGVFIEKMNAVFNGEKVNENLSPFFYLGDIYVVFKNNDHIRAVAKWFANLSDDIDVRSEFREPTSTFDMFVEMRRLIRRDIYGDD